MGSIWSSITIVLLYYFSLQKATLKSHLDEGLYRKALISEWCLVPGVYSFYLIALYLLQGRFLFFSEIRNDTLILIN